MWTTSLPPLHLTLDRSPLLERLITGTHLIAVLSIGLSGIAWPLQLALAGTVLAHLVFHRTFGRAKTGGRLVYGERIGWALEEEGREAKPLAIRTVSLVSPWLIILHGHDGNRSRRWVIARDSLDAETFRCLRVTLRVMMVPSTVTIGRRQPPRAGSLPFR